MCRFSASLAPPEAPVQQDGLQGLLGDVDVDDFNWFDAIDEMDDSVMATEGVSESASAPRELPQAASGPIPQASSQPSPSPHGSGSDASSFDLVEMFRQQVEQQAAPVAAVAGPAFVAAPPPAFLAAGPVSLPFAALPQQQLMCGMPGPFATACMAPAFLPATLAGAAASAPAAGLNNAGSGTPAAAMEPCRSGSGAAPAGSTSGGRRSRSQKTQEEIDAAVERIKQKRRESAQRSRARKNDYMRQLELENQALKDEVLRLQQVLAAVQRSTFQQHQAATLVQLGAM